MKRLLLALFFLLPLGWASDVQAQCTGTFGANEICGTTAGGFPNHTPSVSFPVNPVFPTGITAPSLTAPASTNLGLNAPTGQDVQLQINGTPITVQQATAFLPTSDNAIILGGASNRWSSFFTVLGNYTGTQTYAAGSFLNNQTTLIPTSGDANHAYAAFFNPCVNATTPPCTGGGALPSTGVIFNLNRVKVGEAALSSADYLVGPPAIPSTPSWLDTLFQQAIVGTSQLASGAALGTTGITGYARTSDFFKYAGSASLGSQGGTFVAYNDDTSGTDPIADAILMIAVQHSGGTGLTTLGTQIDINAATQADISPNAQNVSETIGALITSGAYSALAAAKPSAAINIAYGGFKTFRKGIVVSATSLDPTVGCGGSCGIFADLPGGGNSGHAATIRWLNSTPAVDSEVWGDANGFNINSAAKIVGAATFNNQIIPAYGTPTIASGACGATSNGTLGAGSTNQAGLLQIGSATTTTCTVSFSTTLAAAPLACVLFPANAAAAATGTTVARVSSISTSSWVLTGSALANANYYYHCI